EDLEAAAERWRELFAGYARPHVALLVGGTTRVARLDSVVAARMASEVREMVEASGGALLVVTSPRTGNGVLAALRENLAGNARLYEWKRGDPNNPYLGCLAVADTLIVTGDSESMLAEAAATTKPLYIYPLPPRPMNSRRRVRYLVASYAKAEAAARSPLRHMAAALLQRFGLVHPARDLAELHRQLV